MTTNATAVKLPVISSHYSGPSAAENPKTPNRGDDDLRTQKDYIQHAKKAHAYSPAVAKLFDLYENYIPDAEAAYASGKKNAIFGGGFGWTSPLIYALDTIPVAYGEMGRLADHSVMSIAEDHYQFPVETCSMVKCVVGQWYLRRDNPKAIKKILGASAMCEPYNMAWEIMKKEGYDVHTIDVLYRSGSTDGRRLEELITFFIEQVYTIIEWVTGSREFDENKLRFELARQNRIQKKIRQILDLRLKHPYYLKTLPTIVLLNVGLGSYYGKPEEYEAVVDELLAELTHAEINPDELKRVIPLVWAGGTGQEFGIYEAIDQAGGALLGLRSAPLKPYREDVPPLEALARYTYDNLQGGSGIFVQQLLEREVKKVNARGIVLYGVIGCSFQSIDKEMWRDHFHKQGIPSINLEGSFQVGAPTGQLMTRVKAFIEMLE
jgi:benzoyl-CoA reductase/2-hydroxyglutaryl-CoA dehydratase subunit BcrC/BadD/HgdB